MKLSVTLSLLVSFLYGCAAAPQGAAVVDSVDDLPSVQKAQSRILGRLEIGMTLEEFKTAMPEAYIAGQSRKTTAYEYELIQKYVTRDDITRQNLIWGIGTPKARSDKQVLWFYFYSDRLVQWGEPQDWPERPDLILETRHR